VGLSGTLRDLTGYKTALSRHLGKNANAVTQTLATPGYSVPTELAIAEELNRKPFEVWPDRFEHDGTPVSFRVDRIPSRSSDADLRRNGVAA